MLADGRVNDGPRVAVVLLDRSQCRREHVLAGARGPVDLEGGEDRPVEADGVVVDGAADDALDERFMMELDREVVAHTPFIGAGVPPTIVGPVIAAPDCGKPALLQSGDRTGRGPHPGLG
jgi:hypothetical protein